MPTGDSAWPSNRVEEGVSSPHTVPDMTNKTQHAVLMIIDLILLTLQEEYIQGNARTVNRISDLRLVCEYFGILWLVKPELLVDEVGEKISGLLLLA